MLRLLSKPTMPGIAHLRFGNGDEGRQPDAGTAFTATYRVGNGPAGNVGAGMINYIVFNGVAPLVPRNPMAAVGGTPYETAADVRMIAPYAFRDVLLRAVTADDYATLAKDNARRLAERPRFLARQRRRAFHRPEASRKRLANRLRCPRTCA